MHRKDQTDRNRVRPDRKVIGDGQRAGLSTWTFDLATRRFIVSANVGWQSIGPGPVEPSDRFLDEALDPADRVLVGEALEQAANLGAEVDLQVRVYRESAKHWVRMIGGASVDADRVIRSLNGVMVDIDEQKRLEESLREREDHLHSILETAPDGMVVIDQGGIMHSFSTAAERMFGHSRAEAVGRNVSMLMAEPDRSAHDGYIARYLKTGKRRIIGIGRIVTGLRKDGSTFPMHLSIGEMSAGERRLFTGFVHDLTEERRTHGRLQQLQTELAHVSRLNAMGEMGSALAHELNQPLSAISNYMKGSRRLLEKVDSPEVAKIEAALDKAAEQAIRAGQIIRRLREFVARRESERSVESLTKMIEEATALGLVGAREQGVQLKFDLDPTNDWVLTDRVQVQQVLVNLLRNSLEAMADVPRRELSVASRRVAGDLIEVAVADTGQGFAGDALSKLFQPFFTTKKAGMGVGLSISRSIIEAHGGQMVAETNQFGGATFRFTLPLASIEDRGHGG